jgi:hypothetical protein
MLQQLTAGSISSCIKSELKRDLENSMIDVLRDGLFHREQIVEFPQVLQQLSISSKLGEKGGKAVIFSYPKQLFDHVDKLEKIARDDQSSYGMC